MVVAPGAGTGPYSFVGATVHSQYYPGVDYFIERSLGEGGTAIAFFTRRHSPEGETPVVMKVILPRIVMESGQKADTIFKKEAVALGRLNERVPPTPYVLRMIETGAVPYEYARRQLQLPWIALEYVDGGLEGTTLEERVEYSVQETGSAFDPERAARLVRSLCDGLYEIHQVGVVHRDLTPGNVLCCGHGASEMFKISDFGIARPKGLAATFGTDVLVGTPGYMAPEQLAGGTLGPQTDIFSLAAIIYFALTGRRYFEASSGRESLSEMQQPRRPSLLDANTLSAELRNREASCNAIDMTLARATAFDAAQRPANARQFAASLLPWLTHHPRSRRASARHVRSLSRIRPTEPQGDTSWSVRHPPRSDQLIVSLGWNAAGHCLAVTTRGLLYWDGGNWLEAPTANVPAPMRFVQQLDPSHWLLTGEQGLVLEYSRDGVRELLRAADPSVCFTAASGDPDETLVLVGEQTGGEPRLYAATAGNWLPALAVAEASAINAVTQLDDARYLVVGRDTSGRAYAATYHPARAELTRIAAPPGRALLALDGRPERGLATAVGCEGGVLRIRQGQTTTTTMEAGRDVSAIWMDLLGREWVAGVGRIWLGHASQSGWNCMWQDDSWKAPFVGILAETGFVVAVTVEGAVLECRSSMLAATAPG